MLASIVLCAIPGPSLLFTIGRALAEGRRVALLSVLGNGLGILSQILLIAIGLGPLVARSAVLYGVLKFAGAAYLIYLGIGTIRHRRDAEAVPATLEAPRRPARHAIRDGYLVGVTNPKTIVFFIALLPQFVDPARARWRCKWQSSASPSLSSASQATGWSPQRPALPGTGSPAAAAAWRA